MNVSLLQANLEKLGYTVSVFERKEDARDYLSSSISGKTVGFGGSVTLSQMNVYENLAAKNSVFWHLKMKDRQNVMQVRKDASNAQIYITSVNSIYKITSFAKKAARVTVQLFYPPAFLCCVVCAAPARMAGGSH